MLDHNELRKYFTKAQQEDMIQLEEICTRAPPGRIRRARLRKPKPGHIPRPVNSFMSYRTEKQSIIRQFCPTANHREISKIVAKWWHNAAHNEKAVFIDKAAAAKDAHAEKYPDYIFRPKAKKSRKTATAIANAAVNLDTKKSNEQEKYNSICTQPFQTAGMQGTNANFLYQDGLLFADNDNLWTNPQRDYQYADNQFPALPSSSSPYYPQSVPQYSMTQTNQTMTGLDATLSMSFFDPILTNAANHTSGQPYFDSNSNSNSMINPPSYDFNTNQKLQSHVNPSHLCLGNGTPVSQALETPLLDYNQSPAIQQPFDSSLLTAENTPVNINTPSFQMDNYYQLFPNPISNNGNCASLNTSKPLHSNNSENHMNFEYGNNNYRLLFNDESVWDGLTE